MMDADSIGLNFVCSIFSGSVLGVPLDRHEPLLSGGGGR